MVLCFRLQWRGRMENAMLEIVVVGDAGCVENGSTI
jgi:hypothetical protein